MATPNFRHMKDFPLFVCGDAQYDDYFARELVDDIKLFNKQFYWYQISVISGYYEGIQLYVELANEPDNVNELTLEKVLVKEKLKELADNYGMKEIRVVGIFSNGEAIYENI
jgi:hypothetical protein